MNTCLQQEGDRYFLFGNEMTLVRFNGYVQIFDTFYSLATRSIQIFGRIIEI